MLALVSPKREQPLLTSRQAAERLGVKLETLYAYVARGLIRGEPSRGAKHGPAARRYARRTSSRRSSRGGGGVAASLPRPSRRPTGEGCSTGATTRLRWPSMPASRRWRRCSGPERAASRGRCGPPSRGLDRGRRPARHVQCPMRRRSCRRRSSSRPWLRRTTHVRRRTWRACVATGKRLVTRLVAAFASARGISIEAAARGPMAARVLAALGVRAGRFERCASSSGRSC